MPRKVLQFTLSPAYDDDVIMLLPFEENLENESIYEWDYESDEEALELLTAKWSKPGHWDYYEKTTVTLKLIDAYTEKEAEEIGRQLELFIREKQIELPILPKSTETAKCESFEIICFKENMWTHDMWSRPFDSAPEECNFSCGYAYDCMVGTVFSKDYAYFDCDCCGRTICEQNPSNGWMVQYRWMNEDNGYGDKVCLRCYKEYLFQNGVDLDDVLERQTISGMFFNTSDLEREGFTVLDGMDGCMVGSGYSGYSDPNNFFNKLKSRYEELKDKIVIFEYESMAIGGLGGYVTVWVKDRIN